MTVCICAFMFVIYIHIHDTYVLTTSCRLQGNISRGAFIHSLFVIHKLSIIYYVFSVLIHSRPIKAWSKSDPRNLIIPLGEEGQATSFYFGKSATAACV